MAADPHAPAEHPAAARARAQLDDARHHLDAARATADAGTDVPDSARLRQVKRAVNLGLRPVTSHQVPFNHELLLTVERLAAVVESVLAGGAVTAASSTAPLTSAEATDAVVTALASLEISQADTDDSVAALEAEIGELRTRLTAAESTVAALRQTVGAARAREETVLRLARQALAGAGTEAAGPPADLAGLAATARQLDDELLERLAAAGRADPATRRAHAEALAPAVAAASAGAPVLDLASGAGEWVEVWIAHEMTARGVEGDPERAGAATARGLDVATADPVTHLAGAADGSLGAVTAAELADVRPLADVVAVVDDAMRALRPGGALVLVAAQPATQASGGRAWADPRRRPVAPELLELLVLERGGAEVEVIDLDPETYAVVARTAGGGAPG